jgi:hypothetical protein
MSRVHSVERHSHNATFIFYHMLYFVVLSATLLTAILPSVILMTVVATI